MSEWWNRVYLGSCENMAQIPDASVNCCVTSPPYFGLRDYCVDKQIGLESTLAEYVERLVNVFREVRRVLRDDGTAWVVMGDSYCTASTSGPQGVTGDRASRTFTAEHLLPKTAPGCKPKDLMGVPWALAFALRDDGWYLRDAIIWQKPNPMPSSVTDRCTPSYETVFMLAKSAKYFADMDAVCQKLVPHGPQSIRRGTAPASAHGCRELTGNMKHGATIESPMGGANLRNVWTIATTPYSNAHFACYPLALASRCIRIGCPPGGIVLDPFMGSGTTAEAAESLGRRWVGFELNPAYLPLIAERTRQRGLFSA